MRVTAAGELYTELAGNARFIVNWALRSKTLLSERKKGIGPGPPSLNHPPLLKPEVHLRVTAAGELYTELAGNARFIVNWALRSKTLLSERKKGIGPGPPSLNQSSDIRRGPGHPLPLGPAARLHRKGKRLRRTPTPSPPPSPPFSHPGEGNVDDGLIWHGLRECVTEDDGHLRVTAAIFYPPTPSGFRHAFRL